MPVCSNSFFLNLCRVRQSRRGADYRRQAGAALARTRLNRSLRMALIDRVPRSLKVEEIGMSRAGDTRYKLLIP